MNASGLLISVGADPELWLRDKTSGKIVSAHNLMPGTKLEPHKVKYGAVQVDGVAAEFNIDPAYDARQFVGFVQNVKGAILGFAGENFELVEEPVAMFDPGYFKALPENVRELGCNPDFNAWTGQINIKPDGDHPVNGAFMRTAAGHIHIGWGDGFDPNDPTHFEDCRIITKQLDYFLGVYSLMWDSDDRRRSMYGKAGAFRPKTYGVEYRPLSNVWLRSNKLQEWIFNATQKAVLDVIQGGKMLEDKFGDVARQIIDNNITDWYQNSKYSGIRAYTDMEDPPKIVTKADLDRDAAQRKLYAEAATKAARDRSSPEFSSSDYASVMKKISTRNSKIFFEAPDVSQLQAQMTTAAGPTANTGTN